MKSLSSNKHSLIFFFIIFLLGFNLATPKVNALDSSIVTIKGNKFVADTLNGVDALYRTGSSDGSNNTYSCAAFVKRYYKEVYGIHTNNFFYNKTPKADGDKFIKITAPQIGDIAACYTNRSTTHWAIVKEVSDDGSTVVLIEQNWKWKQGGKTVTQLNRSVSTKGTKFYRLNSVQRELNKATD